MSVSPQQEIGRRRVEELIERYGCIPRAPDGPFLSEFGAKSLSDAIEKEIERSKDYGWSKITIHMDMPDAKKLVEELRR